MRIFKFEKDKEQKISKKVKPLVLNDKSKFNNIIIKNPSSSKYLCIINGFTLKVNDRENEIYFMCSDKQDIIDKGINLGCLNIDYGLIDYQSSDNLELDTKEIQSNNELELLEDDFIIILPGGSLCINFKQPIDNLEIGISMGEEAI